MLSPINKNIECYKHKIISLYIDSNMSCNSIGLLLGISHSTVHKHLKGWGIALKSPTCHKISKCEKYKMQIINMYYNQNLSLLKISNILQIKTSTIFYNLNNWGFKLRSHSEIMSIPLNHDYFQKINTEEVAYWLGFLYADGYVSGDYVGLCLSIVDKTHIEKFRTAINSEHNIKVYEANSYGKEIEYARLRFKSTKMVNDLIDKGCVRHKSLLLKFPDNRIINKKLLRHFLRGYFDGDGSLILTPNSINFKICGTREFLEDVIKIFNENIPGYSFNNKLYKRRKDSKNNFYISYGGIQKTYAVIKWLYHNSKVFLDRKYEKYIKLLCKISNRTK